MIKEILRKTHQPNYQMIIIKIRVNKNNQYRLGILPEWLRGPT